MPFPTLPSLVSNNELHDTPWRLQGLGRSTGHPQYLKWSNRVSIPAREKPNDQETRQEEVPG